LAGFSETEIRRKARGLNPNTAVGRRPDERGQTLRNDFIEESFGKDGTVLRDRLAASPATGHEI
jgi:hypothetical protein